MSDSEFVAALRKERKELVPLAEAAELPAARETKRLANEEYQGHVESKRKSGVGYATTQLDHDLNAAATTANHAVAAIERDQERAQSRIKEIDNLLTAAGDTERARKDLTKANASVADRGARVAQLAQIAADLEGEIKTLVEKRAQAIEQHGRDDLAQRLAGKTAPTPDGLAALDADLESRRAALVATQSAKAEAEAPLPALIEEAEGARTRLRGALQRAAELAYFELLPTVLPVIARLTALRSRLCDFESIEIHVDREMLEAARHALREEVGVA